MRVLIADDDPVALRLLGARLRKWGYEVLAVSDGEAAWSALQAADAPSLAILDWQMPQMDGVDVCRRVRELPAEPYRYLVLLTAKNSVEDVVAGLEAGADDYLAKPFDPNELHVRLRNGRRILELYEQLIAARQAMSEKATRDALTGLWNRGAVLEHLANELARAARERSSVGVLLADVDHFKRVNDTYGHLAGDAVLRETARRILAARRRYDLVGRYGGEEILIVAPGCGLESALSVAERLREAVGRAPMDTSDGLIAVTMSIGVSAWVPGGAAAEPETLVRAADEALYRAKEGGRNRVAAAVASGLGAPAASG